MDNRIYSFSKADIKHVGLELRFIEMCCAELETCDFIWKKLSLDFFLILT